MREGAGRWLPEARVEGLVVEELPDELLVYDLERHEAHCLQPALAALWRRCDGRRSVSELLAALGGESAATLDEGAMRAALERLERAGLLTEASAPRARRPSRRQWLEAATAAGLALATIVAPTVSDAASNITDAQCRLRNPNACGGTSCTGATACVRVNSGNNAPCCTCAGTC